MDKALRIAILLILMFLTAIPTFRFIDSTIFLVLYAYHGTQISLQAEEYYLVPLLVVCAVLFFASSHFLLGRMPRRFTISRLWVVIEVVVLVNVAFYGGIAIRDFPIPYLGFRDMYKVTQRYATIIGKFTIIGRYLEIQVSPPGYPTPGQSWTIDVYVVNVTSSGTTFQPALNSSVVINLLSKGQARTYKLPVNEYGRASFRFLPEYSDIAFQAYKSGLGASKTVILRKQYAPHSDVDNLLVSLPFSVILGVIRLITRKRRVSKLTAVILILTFSLFCFVALISLYLKFFQFTIWGYPKIIYSFITIDLLKYTYFFAFVFLFVLVFQAIYRYLYA